MDQLQKLVDSNIEWLIDRVIACSEDLEYVKKYNISLAVWRNSVISFSSLLLNMINNEETTRLFSADISGLPKNPLAAYVMEQARNHRSRGINLGMFIGLLKYYRQAYLDLVADAGFEPDLQESSIKKIQRFFNYIDFVVCYEWSEILTKTEYQLTASNEELIALNEELTATNEQLIAADEELNQQLAETEKNRQLLAELNRQLKDSEETIRQSRDYYLQILNEISALIRVSDTEAKTTFFNKAWLEFVGHNLEQEKDNGWTQGVHPEDLEFCLTTFLKAVKERKQFEMEYRLRRHDGEYRWINDIGSPYYDIEGNYAGFIGYCLDVTKRKQSELVTKRYQLLSERAHDIILFLSLDGRILEANQAAVQAYGYTREELLKLTIFDLRKDPADLVKQQIDQGYKKGMLFETEHVRKDGSILPVEVNPQGALIGDEQIILSIIRDITERRQGELKLRESEELNRTVLSSLMSNIAVLDKNGCILAVNAAWNRFALDNQVTDPAKVGVGVNYLEVCSKASGDNYYPAQEALAGIQAVINKSRSNFYMEYPCHSPERKRWFLLYATPLTSLSGGAVVSHLDITGRKLAEEALFQEKERLEVTLRSIGDGVIATDTGGRVLLVNKMAEKLTGWSRAKAANKPLNLIFNIIDATTLEKIEDIVQEVIVSRGISKLHNEAVLIARDGKQCHVSISAAPIFDSSSKILGVILAFRDITELRFMEQEVLKANKLESVSILAGGIAHDFNNILTGIMGNTSMARIYAGADKNMQEVVSEIENAALRARDLTQQLLTFAKGGMPVKETASAADLIRETSEFVLRGSNVKCKYNIPSDLWPVYIDRGQISQVINNIVINAQQAMPDGGSIKITCSNVIVGKGQQLPLSEGNYIKITIEDSGIGIPKEYQQKIFDPYFTTKQKGSGLGMAISYSIITKHGGHIGVDSISGSGSSFYIYLPASREQIEPGYEKQKTLAGSGRILVMDDEEIVRNVAGKMLQHLGYEFESAEDGEQAIRLYHEAMNSERAFDAVIMDLTVPGGMGGRETIKRLIEKDPKIKAIVSSGYSNDPVMANYTDFGFSGVVVKPFRIEELSMVLNQLVNKDKYKTAKKSQTDSNE